MYTFPRFVHTFPMCPATLAESTQFKANCVGSFLRCFHTSQHKLL